MRDQETARRKKPEILKVVRDLKAALAKDPSEATPSVAPVTDELLPQAIFASTALSTLLSGPSPRSIFRFDVRLAPEDADPFFTPTALCSFDYSIEITATHVGLRIHAVPTHLSSAPGEYLHVLVTFLAASAYMEAVSALYPAKRWSMDAPAESMLMDALATSEAARDTIRRKLWN